MKTLLVLSGVLVLGLVLLIGPKTTIDHAKSGTSYVPDSPRPGPVLRGHVSNLTEPESATEPASTLAAATSTNQGARAALASPLFVANAQEQTGEGVVIRGDHDSERFADVLITQAPGEVPLFRNMGELGVLGATDLSDNARVAVAGSSVSWAPSAGDSALAPTPIYSYKQIAKTGDLGILRFDREVSINSSGDVAFIGILDDGGAEKTNIFVGNGSGGSLRNISPSITSAFQQTIGPSVMINDAGTILARRIQVHPVAGPESYLETWDASSVDSGFTQVFAATFFTEFQGILPYHSINNAGGFVFGAFTGGGSTNWVASTTTQGSFKVQITSPLEDMVLADTESFVMKLGSKISYLPPFFIPFETIASNTNGFVTLGTKPGVSADGEMIAFIGDRGSGEGLFVAAKQGSAWVFDSILGEGTGSFTDFDELQRVALETSVCEVDGNPGYTVAFVGTSGGGTGIYCVDVYFDPNTSSCVCKPATPVVLVGDVLYGKTINELRIHDPLNDLGEVVFHATNTDGTEQVNKVQVRFPTDGRVQWANGQPIRGAEIEAYYFLDSDPLQLKPLPLIDPNRVTRTTDDGAFCMPPELTGVDIQGDEFISPAVIRGIRAKITYNEITGDGSQFETTRTVVNYPDWDPLRPYKTPTGSPVTINFPLPVFFQAGVAGQINSGYGSSDGKMKAFLTLDAGATPAEITTLAGGNWQMKSDLNAWAPIKKGNPNSAPFPAFLQFSMPSGGPIPCPLLSSFPISVLLPSDGVPWGYSNCAIQTASFVDASADRVSNHFLLRIHPEIDRLTPGGLSKVPFIITGHSLGGIITRSLHFRKSSSLKIAKYITFDSPHGGVFIANLLPGLFWGEPAMNGVSATSNTPPLPEDRGWNYFRRLPTRSDHLLFSSSTSFIRPKTTGTAFGYGRIMFPLGIFQSQGPNGYCESFHGGWQLTAYGDGHSLQNVPRCFMSAARFASTGLPPTLGSNLQPAAPLVGATFGTGMGGSCPSFSASSGSVGELRLEMLAPAGMSSNEPIFFDEPGSLHLEALVTRADASVIVLDSVGMQIPPANESIEFLGPEAYMISYDIVVSQGMGSLRLIAGSNDAIAYTSILTTNSGVHAACEATPYHSTTSGQVVVNAQMLDVMSNTIVGGGGIGSAKVTHPDGSVTNLVLLDDGLNGDGAADDGLFGAFFSATSDPGRYQLSSDLTIDLGSAVLARRSAENIFFVDSDAAALLGVVGEQAVDDDGDLLFDAIEVDLDVLVLANGRYRVRAQVEELGTPLEEVSTAFDVISAPETRTVTLRIGAEMLQRQGSGGPFTLTTPEVFDDVEALTIDSIPDYTTQAYLLNQFAVPPAPVLAFCLPSFGKNVGGIDIVIGGSGLTGVTQVFFGTEESLSFEVLGDQSLRAVLPPWNGQLSAVPIKVVTPWGETEVSGLFEYETESPVKHFIEIGQPVKK